MSQMCPNRPVSTQATEEWFPRMRTEPTPFVWGLEVAAHQEIIDEAMEGNDVQDQGEGPGT